jgi:hypothetical protein
MIKAFDQLNLLRKEYSLAVNRKKLLDRLSHKLSAKRIVKKSKSAFQTIRQEIDLDVPNLVMEANDFQLRTGYYPISFSKFENTIKNQSIQNRKPLSTIIPGDPYSYDSYERYLWEYEKSMFAITHKKGGWDCYRHIEILESGCIPLMHDARKIPEGSMFYYPKELFALIYENYLNGRIFEHEHIIRYLEKWFTKYLSSKASVHNMLELSGFNQGTHPSKCLFVDLELHKRLDYLSAMVLSGLFAQESIETFILGRPPEYMFQDYEGDVSMLYGRGFGYSRILEPKSRRTVEIESLDFEKYDFVVVGSALRNRFFLEKYRENLKTSKLIILDGADEPISQVQLRWLKSFLHAKIFVRES